MKWLMDIQDKSFNNSLTITNQEQGCHTLGDMVIIKVILLSF